MDFIGFVLGMIFMGLCSLLAFVIQAIVAIGLIVAIPAIIIELFS